MRLLRAFAPAEYSGGDQPLDVLNRDEFCFFICKERARWLKTPELRASFHDAAGRSEIAERVRPRAELRRSTWIVSG